MRDMHNASHIIADKKRKAKCTLRESRKGIKFVTTNTTEKFSMQACKIARATYATFQPFVSHIMGFVLSTE